MGLDIYVVHKDEAYLAGEAIEKLQEAEMEAISESRRATIGDKHYELPDYREISRASKLKHFGSEDAWGHPDSSREDIPCAKYPEHMFKIGYFRSSYNEGGIEHILSALGLPGLEEIFDYQCEYEFAPDWGASLRRARDVLDRYSKLEKSYRQFFVGANPFSGSLGVKSAEEAVEKAIEGLKTRTSFESFGTAIGEFFPKGLSVVALIPGTQNWIGGQRNPGVYVVVEQGEESREWYKQALEIVVETCEYVLAQPDPERWMLHWSS